MSNSAPPLRLHAENDGIESAAPAPVEPANDTPAEARPPRPAAAKILAAAVEPLVVPAKHAAPLCGVSEATWWRLHAGALCPAPVKVGSRTLWRVAELRAWVDGGTPDRRTWEARKGASQGRGR